VLVLGCAPFTVQMAGMWACCCGGGLADLLLKEEDALPVISAGGKACHAEEDAFSVVGGTVI